jgi:DNA invertase Pin-like site-specific DNA recombinase
MVIRRITEIFTFFKFKIFFFRIFLFYKNVSFYIFFIIYNNITITYTISSFCYLLFVLFNKGIGFRSICDGAIDTTTASGKLIFNIFSSLAQFERRLIQKRTRAGLEAARSRGRKKIQSTDPRVLMAKKMHKDHGMSIDNICKTLKISRASFYRYLGL